MSQILFLTGMYGYVLFLASNLISDGSELLLLVPRFAPVVGSVVLPVLGAVPDGMMVLFSGLGPDAQNQVSVGVGALAGSTIMLLTLPWFLAILSGRVNIVDGKPTYKRPAGADPSWTKLDPPTNLSLLSTGVAVTQELKTNAKTMCMTCLAYAIIQVPALMHDHNKSGDTTKQYEKALKNEAGAENLWALVGLFACIVLFARYLYDMWKESQHTEGAVVDKIAETNVQAMKSGQLSLRGALAQFRTFSWDSLCNKGNLDEVLLDKRSMDEVKRMCKILAPFFAYYDANGDNKIDCDEFCMIFKDVHEALPLDMQKRMFEAADVDQSGYISFEEFVACLMSFALDPCNDLSDQGDTGRKRHMVDPKTYLKQDEKKGDEEEEDDEEQEMEDIPEDLADLEPEAQQVIIKRRAFMKMAFGTGLVLIFSDPMVDLLGEIGNRLDISGFYVAFVLAPLASNASELVAAYNYAKKRTVGSITTSLSTLEGAGIMNNTFCLGIFLALVYFKHLAWEFTAETLSIVIIQFAVAAVVLTRDVSTLLDGVIVLSFYPLSLLLVYVLENKLGLD
eukprot:CAMPEP_0178412988 /NCGR_PEP_ID=MMETSP0689_2-20121128/22298_1 /TAXON_ID=160604 /ORGANISM="Amphidinium massartii, Strain CS-259" /LENGTH=563 /DNA_ID=CAMNT_0020034251 /DNA_START=98 /DNA_END=1789 /DNA_ORIENTATION=-